MAVGVKTDCNVARFLHQYLGVVGRHKRNPGGQPAPQELGGW